MNIILLDMDIGHIFINIVGGGLGSKNYHRSTGLPLCPQAKIQDYSRFFSFFEVKIKSQKKTGVIRRACSYKKCNLGVMTSPTPSTKNAFI